MTWETWIAVPEKGGSDGGPTWIMLADNGWRLTGDRHPLSAQKSFETGSTLRVKCMLKRSFVMQAGALITDEDSPQGAPS